MPEIKYKKCCRCTRTRLTDGNFEKGIKTCNFCRKQKASYLKTNIGKENNKKRKLVYLKTKKGKNTVYKNYLTSIYKYPEKYKARLKVYYALKTHKIKKDKCFCKNEKTEAHHPDYSKPLEVVWLCREHHYAIHHK